MSTCIYILYLELVKTLLETIKIHTHTYCVCKASLYIRYMYTYVHIFTFVIRRDFYSICQEAGLGGLASKFGLTPGQFGENLRDNYQRHDTEQYPHEPEEAAQEFIQLSGLVNYYHELP